MDARGEPAAGAAIVTQISSARLTSTSRPGVVNPDGTFVLAGFPIGNHVLGFSLPRGSITEVVAVPVTVQGNVDDLLVATGIGTAITGQVIFDGARPTDKSLVELRVLPIRVDRDNYGPLTGTTGPPGVDGFVGTDGRFSTKAFSNDRILFTMRSVPPGWMIKSVTADGEDITDVLYRTRGNLSDVRITLTDKLTTIAGGVTNGRGQGVSSYVVVVQPAEEKEPLVTSRVLRTAIPDTSGRFDVRGMRPGRYVATAVQSIEPNMQYFPDFQRDLRLAGREFTLGDGQTVNLDLRLIEGL